MSFVHRINVYGLINYFVIIVTRAECKYLRSEGA